jgi:hypothetical protein
MADDIERFLLQAAQRRRARKLPTPRPPQPQPQDAEIIEAESVGLGGLRSGGLESRVAEDLDTSEFSERASHLGERVGKADDKMEARLQSKFDHQVGRLGGAASTDTAAEEEAAPETGGPAPSPGNLAQWLRSPDSLRQAIVLSEILERPEHRW